MKDKELKTCIRGLVSGSGRSHPSLEETEKRASEELGSVPGKQQVTSGDKNVTIENRLNGALREETSVA